MVVPEYSEVSIDAVPPTEDKGTEPFEPDTESETSDDSTLENPVPPISVFTPSAVVNGAVNLTYTVVRFYTAPIRFMFSFMPTSMSHMPILSKLAQHAPSEHALNEKQALAKAEPLASVHTNGSAAALTEINPVCQ